MSQKIDKKHDETSITTIIIFVIVVAIAALASAFLILTSGVLQPHTDINYYNIQIEEYNKNFIIVRTITFDDDLPLTSVTLSILEHGEGRLLSGPYSVNETGCAILQIPEGYSKYFDIVGNYKGVTQTFTVDKRPHLVKSESKLGSLGIALITAVVSFIFGILGGISWRGRKIKP
jgi:flagellar basal body-associated protein FliL